MSKSWMAMSRIMPPEVLRYEAGGGAGSRLVMTANSRVPISPPASRSCSARKDGSKRRLKPTMTRGAWRAISFQHARARCRSRSTGFSQNTALPALTAAVTSATWVSVGVATKIAATFGSVSASSTSRAAFTPSSVATCCAACGRTSNTMTRRARGWRARLRACIRPMRPQPSTATPSMEISVRVSAGASRPAGQKFIAGGGRGVPAPHRASHDVEIVQIEPVRGAHRVITTRHQHHVAILHRHRLIERAIVGVDALKGEAPGTRQAVIVGLLERSLFAARGVVLVRWITRPVSARCHHLDHDQSLRLRARRQQVADVAGVGAGAAHLLADGVGPDEPRRESPAGGGCAHRELALGLRPDAHP